MSLEESSDSLLCNDNKNGSKPVSEVFGLRVVRENAADHNSAYLKKWGTESASAESVDQIEQRFSKSGIVNPRHKGLSLPLLDLHKDHDIDSLPSPTRDLSATLPFDKDGLLKPEWPVPRQTLDRGNPVMHPYETDAVKAVSSYQQKFGQGSIFMNDRLPSPTPSGEGDTNGDGDVMEEVSSSANLNVNAAVNVRSGQPVLSSSAFMDSLVSPEISNASVVGPASNSGPVLKSSSSRSRDPRLRLANSDTGPRNLSQSLSSVVSDETKSEFLGRKQKILDDLVFDGPAPKRRRNELSDPKTTLPLVTALTSQVTIPTTSLPANNYVTLPSISQTEMLPTKNPSASSSLHSLLRDIAGNPSVWMNMLKAEHQKSSDMKGTMQMANTKSILGAVPLTSGILPSTPMLGQTSSAGIVPSQTVSAVGTCASFSF